MITDKDIARINELYHKSKTEEGLTPEEKEEKRLQLFERRISQKKSRKKTIP